MARGKKKAADLSPEEKLKQALVPVEEQPYEVPENWCWVKLSELYQVNPKNDAPDEADAAFVPMDKIAGGMVSDFSFEVQPWKKAKKGHTQFADGDVAFAKISPCFENRKSMIVQGLPNGIGGGTTELIILRNPQILPQYTFWLVSNDAFIQGGKQTYSGTVGQQRINMDYVRSYPVPLPPLHEQKRIVDRIESIFSKLDEAKEKAQEVIDGFELRKSAILHQAFSGALTANWRAEHGVGLDSWEKTTLNSVSERIFDGPFGSNLKSDDYTNSGIRVVRLENLKNLWFDDSKQSFVSTEKYETICKHTVYPSDIIMSTFIADEVKVCQMPDYIEYAVNKADCIGIRLTESACKKYILFFLSSKDTYKALLKNIHGATRPRVNTKQIKNIQIPLAPLPEQTEIVRILDTLLTKEAAAKAAAEAVLDQIDTMKEAVLARAFRGELGTNDPAEESAVELLKTVL